MFCFSDASVGAQHDEQLLDTLDHRVILLPRGIKEHLQGQFGGHRPLVLRGPGLPVGLGRLARPGGGLAHGEFFGVELEIDPPELRAGFVQ